MRQQHRPPFGLPGESHESLSVHVGNHLARLASSGRYNAETIEKHCTAIATFFREGPLRCDPTSRAQYPTVRLILDGNSRTNPVLTRRKAPVTLEMLDDLRALCDRLPHGTDPHSLAVTETAVVLLTFFRAMRGNEAVPDTLAKYDPNTNISVGAVTMPHGAQAIVIRIPTTKNRQPGHRAGSGTLMFNTPSRSNDRLDPFWWILDQFQRRRADRAHSTEPFFVDPSGRAITRGQVEKRLRLAAHGADVTLHSPRIGIVNYMRAAGFSTDQIRDWGGWSSSAVETYFRGGAQTRYHPTVHSRPDMNDVVASVTPLRGLPVCPGWGAHDDILASTTH